MDAQGQALAKEEHDCPHYSPRPCRPPLLLLHYEGAGAPGHRSPQANNREALIV